MGTQTPPPSPPRPHPDGPPRRWPGIALRIALPVAAVAVLAVVKPAIIDGTVSSPRALAIVAGVVAATVGWSALLRRVVPSDAARTVLVLAPVAVVLALYVWPYFGPDDVVDEALPGAAPVADAQAATAADDTTATAAPPPTATPTPAPDDPALTGPAPTEPPPPAEPAGPVELSRGSFVGLDSHAAVGDAAVYRLEDGSHIVRLDQVDLEQVPEPYVYLVPGADRTAPEEGAVNLGPLTGNVGSSNYAIPAGTPLDGPLTVLVWCEPFASPVGAASQTPTG